VTRSAYWLNHDACGLVEGGVRSGGLKRRFDA
jgi:hypothetical protein